MGPSMCIASADASLLAAGGKASSQQLHQHRQQVHHPGPAAAAAAGGKASSQQLQPAASFLQSLQHMSGEQSGEAQLRPRARLALLAAPTAGGLQVQVPGAQGSGKTSQQQLLILSVQQTHQAQGNVHRGHDRILQKGLDLCLKHS